MNQERCGPIALGELAERMGAELVGDPERAIRGMRPFDQATGDDLAFLDPRNAKLVAALPGCRAAAVIVDRKLALPPGLNAVRIDPPHLGLARALAILHPRRRARLGVSPAAHVAEGAVVEEEVNVYPGAYLGEGSRVGARTDVFPGAFIGPGVSIGSDCIIHPRVTIYEGCRIGDRVTIHSGAVIGADGFGFVPEPLPGSAGEPYRHTKIPQVGSVVIEDDVEIGANTTIDRATLAETVIGRGTKVDNLVMVAHNCRVGRHVLLVSQAGISGSTTIGDYATIAGQAGLVGHIRVGERAIVTAQAGVTKDVEDGQTVIGAPAMDIREGRLAFGLIGRLPELKKQVGELSKRLERLEKDRDGRG